ncbi:MAG: glycosyltransferase family 39 protein [Bacteroidetes bacterium]|nr:glycosyltransferase family 39 protein [Bacteroidota bacterium]
MNKLQAIINHNLLKDIRFWIILFFAARLFHITNPPLEVAHNWRQTTVTMAARNFYETDSNILYPRVDFAGEKTGITAMEFPVLNYLIYLVSLVFGYAHWYGRLINLVVSSFGILFFYRLVHRFFNPTLAFRASVLLLFSIWFEFSRKIMPDTFSVSLIIAGIYFGTGFLQKLPGKHNLLLCAALTLTGLMAKLPAGYLLIVYAPLFISSQITWRARFLFGFVHILILIPVCFWYFYWTPLLVERYGFHHFFMGTGFIDGIRDIGEHLPEALSRFYSSALQFTGFAVFAGGVVYASVKRDRIIFLFLLCFAAFFVVMGKSGFAFYHHSYYIIPFVPVMALMGGYLTEKIPGKTWPILILLITSAEGILNQQDDFFIKHKDLQIARLESSLDSCSTRQDLIAINSGKYPTPMYFAHRKGWICTSENLKNAAFVDSLKGHGLKFIVILKQTFGDDTELQYSPVSDNPYYRIYKP